MRVYVLCGGLGTRLAHIVKDAPKPMAPIGESPFLEIQLRQLMKGGATDFVLLTGHKAEIIEDYFANHSELGRLVRFSRERSPLGTGGALREALKENPPTTHFAVANGDTFLDCDLVRLRDEHIRLGGIATLAVKYRSDCSRYGRILPCGPAVAGFCEKVDLVSEGLVNAGLYVCSPELAQEIPNEGFVSLEGSVFPVLAERGQLFAMPCEGRFIDIGIEEDYRTAQRNLLRWARTPKCRAAFLDRDGILVEDNGYLRPGEDVLRQDALPLLKRLQNQGYLLIICTNQAQVAKGLFDPTNYNAVRNRIEQLLAQEGIVIAGAYMCPFHGDAALPTYQAESYCRMPEPGMILEAAEEHNLDLSQSFMIGDKDLDRIALPGFRSFLLQGDYAFKSSDNAFASVDLLTEALVRADLLL